MTVIIELKRDSQDQYFGFRSQLDQSLGSFLVGRSPIREIKIIVVLILAINGVTVEAKDGKATIADSGLGSFPVTCEEAMVLSGEATTSDSKFKEDSGSDGSAASELSGVEPTPLRARRIEEDRAVEELFEAAESGNLDRLSSLFDGGGVDPNVRNSKGETLIEVAVANGRARVVEFLIAGDENSNMNFSWEGERFLPWAIARREVHVIEAILLKGEKLDLEMEEYLLLFAVAHGQIRMIEILLTRDLDLNAVKDPSGRGLLHIAVAGDRVKVVETLLAKGANPNAKDFLHKSPLHLAADRGYLKIVKMLIAKGGDVNAKDWLGQSPSKLALNHGHRDVVNFLEGQGRESFWRRMKTVANKWVTFRD